MNGMHGMRLSFSALLLLGLVEQSSGFAPAALLRSSAPRAGLFTSSSHPRKSKLSATSVLAQENKGQQELPEPDGGWAPPAHKRKIINPIKTLVRGMELAGKVRNCEGFGAFVDVGAERDGFVHISDVSTEFVHHPSDLLWAGKEVKCWVKYASETPLKLGLTLVESRLSEDGVMGSLPIERFQEIEGAWVDGRITRITNYGAFVDIGCEVDGFLHVTQLPLLKGRRDRMRLEDLIVDRMFEVKIVEVNMGLRRVKLTARGEDDVDEERVRFAPPASPKDVFSRGPRPEE